jgi:hypothetical protein
VPTVRPWSDLLWDQSVSQRVKSVVGKLPPGTRASIDGQIPASLDYELWLRKDGVFQIKTLGRVRWKLWRGGKLGFEDLISQNNRPLTVAQLRATLE